MKVYVARHAETNYNLLGLCNNNPEIDVYLTPKGIEQAEVLAAVLQSVDFDLIITSDLPRTKETARIANLYHDAPTIADARISDVRTGFEGKLVSDFRDARYSAENKWTIRLNGGESFEDEKARIKSFLDDLQKRSEKTVLVVTHQGIAKLIYANVYDLPNQKVDDIEVNNTHYFDFEF